MRIIFLVFVVLLVTNIAPAQVLEVDPKDTFQVLKTEHFDIIFNARQQPLAQHYAERLERAHSYFSRFVSQMPTKTAVVLNDRTDDPNGYSTRIPYPHIMLFPVVPPADDSLSESVDWAYEFVAHEYTHILTFEPSRGIVKGLRSIFGTIVAPNILLPQWWKEGLAVEMETRATQGGRLRSKYQDALVRTMADDKILQGKTVDLANENLPMWPEGLHPYVFGSYFFSQVLAEKPLKVIDDLLVAHSGRVPYFIDSPANDSLDRDYDGFYNKALREVQTRALRQLTTLREYETTVSQPLKKTFVYSSHPSFNFAGDKLLISAVSDDEESSPQLFQLEGDQWKFVEMQALPKGKVFDPHFFNGSNKLVFARNDVYDRVRTTYELFIFDLDSKKTTRLTKFERAREPSPSPSDKEIAYVSVFDGRTEIKVIQLDNKKITSVLVSGLQERIGNPTWLNENEILFSRKLPNGDEKLFVIDRRNSSVRLAQNLHHSARLPVLKKKSLFFTSAKNGVYNIYQTSMDHGDLNQIAVPITNLTSMALSFDYNPRTEQIAFTELTSHGPEVKLIEAKDWQKPHRKLAQVSGLMADRYTVKSNEDNSELTGGDSALTDVTPQAQTKSNDSEPSPGTSSNPSNGNIATGTSQITEYDPTPYLWPKYWIPFFGTSNTGYYLQAQTANFDPLKKHSYAAALSYDSYLKKAGWQATYQNTVWPLPWSLSGSRESRSLGTVDNQVETDSYAISILPDSWWIQKPSSLSAGWIYSTDTYFGSKASRTGPYVDYAYADFSQSKRQISPQHGYGYSFALQNFISSGSQISYTEAQASAIGFASSSLLPRKHALMGKLSHSTIFESVSAIYGVSSSSYFYRGDTVSPSFVLRGYDTGQFFGKTMSTLNLEYRFPVYDIYQGKGTDPYFFQRFRGAITADAMSVDGVGWNYNKGKFIGLKQSTMLASLGAELKLDMSVGYVLPLTFSLGYYVGQNKDFADSGALSFNLLFGSL